VAPSLQRRGAEEPLPGLISFPSGGSGKSKPSFFLTSVSLPCGFPVVLGKGRRFK
jgi:hypothetical protein